MPDESLKIECTTAYEKVGLLLVCCVAFVVGGLVMTGDPDPYSRIIGWAGVVLFGMGLPILGGMLLRTGVVVRFDGEGIYDRRLGPEVIRWEAIDRLELLSIQGNKFIGVRLQDRRAYLARMNVWARLVHHANGCVGFRLIYVNLGALRPGLREGLPRLYALLSEIGRDELLDL